MPPIPYPLINGVRFDFSSVEIGLPRGVFSGIRSISYKHTLSPGMMRGTRAQVGGLTRGKYDADGSIEFYKSEYQDFITLLGPGYMEKFFPVVVNYSELPSLQLVTDVLNGVRLTSAENSHSEGEDALVVKCDLIIMQLLEGRMSPLNPTKMLR